MLSDNLGDLLSGPFVDMATSESFFIMKLDAKTTLVKLLPVKSLINEAVIITAGKYKGQTGMFIPSAVLSSFEAIQRSARDCPTSNLHHYDNAIHVSSLVDEFSKPFNV